MNACYARRIGIGREAARANAPRIAGVCAINACYSESNLESQLESRGDKYDEGPLYQPVFLLVV